MATQTTKSTSEPKRRKPAAKKQAATSAEAAAPPSYHEIARLAEKYWLERGQPHGSAEQDWLRAERELRGKAS